MNDVRRIAFVSERFLELQGLMPALFGGALIFGALVRHVAGGPWLSGDAVQVFTMAMVAAIQAALPLQRTYRRTFGEQVATRTQQFHAALPMLLVYAGGFVDTLGSLYRPLGGPSAAAVALAAVASWIVVRDAPWRLHYLIAAVAGLAGAIVSASMPSTPGPWGADPGRAEGLILAYTLMGLGLVASGLLDHRLLASSLTPVSSTGLAPVAEGPRFTSRLLIGVAAATPAGVCLWLSDRALSFALPMAPMLSVLAVTMAGAIMQILRAVRDIGKRRPANDGPVMTLGGDALAVVFFIVLAAAVESMLFPDRSPTLLAISVGGSAVWLTARNWRERKRDLVWAVAAAVTLVAIPSLSSARAMALFIVAMAAAFVAHTIAAALAHPFRSEHVDAI